MVILKKKNLFASGFDGLPAPKSGGDGNGGGGDGGGVLLQGGGEKDVVGFVSDGKFW